MKILSMSGFVPEAICDTVRFNGYKGDSGFSHYCGYASDYISQVLSDDTIDGAVFPKTCDSSRSISSFLEESGKFIYPIAVPITDSIDAIRYFAYVVRDYKIAVEHYYKIKITEDEIRDRLELIEARRLKVQSLYEELERGLSYSSYIDAIHAALTKPLTEQKIEADGISDEGIPVYLVGSYLASTDIVKTAERCGLNIVADDLPESGRLIKTFDHAAHKDLYEQIALSVLQTSHSPTLNEYGGKILSTRMEIDAKKCKGVIILTQKYCEPYDYYYSVLKKALDDAAIPSLKIELDGSLDPNMHESELAAFASILEVNNG